MDKIEEVKKILRNNQVFIRSYFPTADALQYQDELAKEISQLFEPKPDESRLLTEQKIHEVEDKVDRLNLALPLFKRMSAIQLRYAKAEALVKAQDAKTASIKDGECQQRVERIFKEIEAHASFRWSGIDEADWWQALKKQEGIDGK